MRGRQSPGSTLSCRPCSTGNSPPPGSPASHRVRVVLADREHHGRGQGPVPGRSRAGQVRIERQIGPGERRSDEPRARVHRPAPARANPGNARSTHARPTPSRFGPDPRRAGVDGRNRLLPARRRVRAPSSEQDQCADRRPVRVLRSYRPAAAGAGSHRACPVRNHPPVQRRQRPHRSRTRARHAPRRWSDHPHHDPGFCRAAVRHRCVLRRADRLPRRRPRPGHRTVQPRRVRCRRQWATTRVRTGGIARRLVEHADRSQRCRRMADPSVPASPAVTDFQTRPGHHAGHPTRSRQRAAPAARRRGAVPILSSPPCPTHRSRVGLQGESRVSDAHSPVECRETRIR